MWGFEGGMLCDAMQAITTVLRCLGKSGSIDAVIVDGDQVIAKWKD